MGKASLAISIYGDYNGKAIEKAEKDLAKLQLEAARQAGGMTQAFAQAGDGIVELGNRMQYAGSKIESAGAKVTKLTAPIAAAGAASVKLAADYEDSVGKVYTIMDKTAMTTDEMSKSILDLSTATGKSAVELAEASYQALSASVATDKVAGFVETSAKLAKAGFTDTATSVDALTTVINAYKLNAEDALSISDKLVQTQNDGKTTVGELGAAMGTIIPTASALNVNLDNVLSSYAIMTKQGIKTTDATTALKNTLSELSDEGSDVAKILMDKTGKTFGQLMEDGMSLGDVLGILYDHVEGNGEAFKNLWGNMRAGTGALAIANAGAEEFSAEMGRMAGATGNVESALDDLATPMAKARKAMNAVKNTGIELGEELLGAAAPSLEKMSQAAQDLYKWFGDLDEGTKQNVVRIGALAVAAGPAITMAGKGVKAIGSLTSGLGKGVQGMASFSASCKKTYAAMVIQENAAGGLSTKVAAFGRTATTAAKSSQLLSGALGAMKVAGAVALVSVAVEKFQAWKEHTDLVAKATQGLNDVISEGEQAYRSFSPSADFASQSMSSVADAAKECLEAQASLADETRSSWNEMKTASAEVDYYAGVIAELGNKGSLTAEEQLKLKDAVEQFNERTGASIGIVNGQTGELNANKDAVLLLAEAWKQEAEAEALKEIYTKYTQQMIEDGMRLEEVTRKLNEADEGFGLWLGEFPVFADEASVKYHDLQQEAQDLGAAQQSAAGMAEDAMRRMEAGAKSFDSLGQALDSCGVKMEDFGDVTDEQLSIMESNFDGTLSSIVRTCLEQGINIPEGLRQGIESRADAPAESMGGVVTSLVEKAKSMLESHSPSQVMFRIGTDVDDGLSNGIDGSASKPETAMSKVAEALRRAVASLPEDSRRTGSSSGANMASAISQQSNPVANAARSIYQSAASGIAPTPGTFSSTGSSAAWSFSGAIGSASAYGSGRSLAGTAQSGLGSVSADGVGRNFAWGFSNGMGSVSIWQAAYNIGMNALSGIKSALGIASPSKEAAKVGEWFGEGAVQGMRRTERAIASETRRLSDLMELQPTAYGTFAPSWAAGASHAASSIVPNAVTMNVVVNVTARTAEEGSAVGRSLADALYEEWSRKEASRL